MVTFLVLLFFALPWHETRAEDNQQIQDRFFYGYCIHLGFENTKAYSSAPDVELKLSQLGLHATRDDLLWPILDAKSLQTMPVRMHKIATAFQT